MIGTRRLQPPKMKPLPLTLLEHTAAGGRHYDLLVRDPTAPDAAEHRLWAARVALPTDQWAGARRLRLTALPMHRARYLDDQGPIAGGRGRIRRIDRGHALARLWTPGRIILDVRTRRFCGRLIFTRHSRAHWSASVAPEA